MLGFWLYLPAALIKLRMTTLHARLITMRRQRLFHGEIQSAVETLKSC